MLCDYVVQKWVNQSLLGSILLKHAVKSRTWIWKSVIMFFSQTAPRAALLPIDTGFAWEQL